MQILGIHIIPGTVKAADLTDGGEVSTATGEALTVSTAGGTVTFTAPNGGMTATVTEADIMSCGNVVHKIDMVLVPAMADDDVADDDVAVDDAAAVMGAADMSEDTVKQSEVFFSSIVHHFLRNC